MSKHTIVPKPRTLLEFTIPEFRPMETQSDKNKSQDPVQQWLSARREALVEVKNYDGKSVMVSRSALIKSQNTREESCY